MLQSQNAASALEKIIQKLIDKTMQKYSAKLNPWHLGTVASVNHDGTLSVYIDGSSEAVPGIPHNPCGEFSTGDRIWVIYINGNSRNLFALCQRR